MKNSVDVKQLFSFNISAVKSREGENNRDLSKRHTEQDS